MNRFWAGLRFRSACAIVCASAFFAAAPAGAAPIFEDTFTGINSATGKTLQAHVQFSKQGNKLQVQLTSIGDSAIAPSDVLTGLFFSVAGNPTLTADDLKLTTTSGRNPDQLINVGPTDNTDLRKEWQFRQLAVPVNGGTYGIGASGLSGTFSSGNFGGVAGNNLGGVNYGIVNGMSPGFNGGASVPLVKRSLTFTLGGYGNQAISNVSVQYGSSLSEPTIPEVPEPAGVSAVGLLALALLRRR